MCLYPKLIKNRKYISNKKNGGNIPAVSDKRVLYVSVGCQNCIECRKQKSREWIVRLIEDIKQNKNAKFVTLTFSTEGLQEIYNMKPTKYWPGLENCEGYELDNQIATRAMRLFLERYRKEYKKSLRHWLVTELGHKNTEHIHLHGLIWTDLPLNTIEKIWKYGFMWKGKGLQEINYVNETTIKYITKYIYKLDNDHINYKPIVLCSPGIGNSYLNDVRSKQNKYNGKETREFYITNSGHKIGLPIYYRNNLYNEEEREKLWLYKLDKETRYVMTEKISIKDGIEDYMKVLKWHQKRNKLLGYGDDTKDWNKIQYENELRTIKIKNRISNASPAGSNQKGLD